MKITSDWQLLFLKLIDDIKEKRITEPNKIYLKLFNIKLRIEKEQQEKEEKQTKETAKQLLKAILKELLTDNE